MQLVTLVPLVILVHLVLDELLGGTQLVAHDVEELVGLLQDIEVDERNLKHLCAG